MKRVVQFIVPLLFVASGASAFVVVETTRVAPTIAFGNHFVFGLQLFLLIFYALLLLTVPLLRGICHGELPIELTARGARFPEPNAEAARALISEEFRNRIEAVERAMRTGEKGLDQVAAIASSSISKLEDEMRLLRSKEHQR